MTLGGYDAFDDPYSYKGGACLKNRLGLRDPEVLQAFELEMSSLRAAEPLRRNLGHPPDPRGIGMVSTYSRTTYSRTPVSVV